MKKSILRIATFGLLAAAIAVAPTQGFAQEKKKKDQPGAEKKEEPKGEKKKGGGIPFHGKADAIDKTAKTVKVGERTFHVSSDTRITKAGKPATLADGVVGEDVGGSYKEVDGKMVLNSIRFGPRPDGEPKGDNKEKKKKD